MPERLKALWAGVAAAALWGGLYPVSKAVMEVVPPFVLLATRLLLGAAILYPFVWRQGGMRWPARAWRLALGVGALGFGFALGLQFVGTHWSTASNGALVTATTPAFVVLFGAWILHERLTRRQAIALVLATLGVLIVIDPRQASLDQFFLGNLALVAAALGWALYSVLIRWLTQTWDTLRVSIAAMLGGLVVVLPPALFQWPQIRWENFTWQVALGVLYVAVFATAIAMFLWNYAFAHLKSSTAALTFFAQPLIGTLVGVWWLGETLRWGFVLGGFLIAGGLYLAAVDSAT
ncbi:MAG: DMT family transporter [Chloroflexi bacterium]|nr:DMT family transporter [Chloroflexota bacterium]